MVHTSYVYIQLYSSLVHRSSTFRAIANSLNDRTGNYKVLRSDLQARSKLNFSGQARACAHAKAIPA